MAIDGFEGKRGGFWAMSSGCLLGNEGFLVKGGGGGGGGATVAEPAVGLACSADCGGTKTSASKVCFASVMDGSDNTDARRPGCRIDVRCLCIA